MTPKSATVREGENRAGRRITNILMMSGKLATVSGASGDGDNKVDVNIDSLNHGQRGGGIAGITLRGY